MLITSVDVKDIKYIKILIGNNNLECPLTVKDATKVAGQKERDGRGCPGEVGEPLAVSGSQWKPPMKGPAQTRETRRAADRVWRVFTPYTIPCIVYGHGHL